MSGGNLKYFQQETYLWRIRVPQNWTSPAHTPDKSIYFKNLDGNGVITISIYRRAENNLSQFANEKFNLLSSAGGRYLGTNQLTVNGFPAIQLVFSGYSSILVAANELIYEIVAIGDPMSNTTRTILGSFQIYSPTSQQMLEQLRMLEFMVGLQGMRDSYLVMMNGIWGWRP